MSITLVYLSIVFLPEQDETAATINDFVVFHSDSRVCVYCVCADPERDLIVAAIAKNPDRRGTAMQSVQPEEVSIVRIAKNHS